VPDAGNIAAVEASTLCLLNEQRAAAGLKAVKTNSVLQNAATAYSRSMVASVFFSHTGADGSQPLDRIRATGYIPRLGTWAIGENLAWGASVRATPRAIMTAWMDSPGHRANILTKEYDEVGVGVVPGVPVAGVTLPGATYTNEFGFRKPAAQPKPKPRPKPRPTRRPRR